MHNCYFFTEIQFKKWGSFSETNTKEFARFIFLLNYLDLNVTEKTVCTTKKP